PFDYYTLCCHILSLSFTLPCAPVLAPLSLHDALPICRRPSASSPGCPSARRSRRGSATAWWSRASATPATTTTSAAGAATPPSTDRKSTRLNSSHVKISYAVFCLKKKKKFNQSIIEIL